jgi:hypothetical protein
MQDELEKESRFESIRFDIEIRLQIIISSKECTVVIITYRNLALTRSSKSMWMTKDMALLNSLESKQGSIATRNF